MQLDAVDASARGATRGVAEGFNEAMKLVDRKVESLGRSTEAR